MQDTHRPLTGADPGTTAFDGPPDRDMPAAAALYQIVAAHGGRGELAAIGAESGLGEERTAAGWRTLADLALVRLSGGQVETLDSDAALDAVVGRYASYAFEALRSVRAVNDATRKLLTVFGPGASAAPPCAGAAYAPYDDPLAPAADLLPQDGTAPADRPEGEPEADQLPYADVDLSAAAAQEPYAVRESPVEDAPQQDDAPREAEPCDGERRPERPELPLSPRESADRAVRSGFGSAGTHGREQILRELAESTAVSVDSLHKGPLPGDPAVLDAYLEMTARLALRGVRMRALCTPTTLGSPGGARYVRAVAAAGAQVRVVDRVGHDMLVCDGRMVCLPDTGCGDPADPAVLRLTSPYLARTFLVVYEAYWQRASPYLPDGAPDAEPLAREREQDVSAPQLGSFEQAVVRLMAAGRSDGSIARELGVGEGAVDAVMASLMRRLGAANRFEAGIRLARALDGARLP